MEAVRRGLVRIEGAVIEAPPTTVTRPEPEPVASPSPDVASWQRVYVVLAACAVVLALFLPGWWQGKGRGCNTPALSATQASLRCRSPRARTCHAGQFRRICPRPAVGWLSSQRATSSTLSAAKVPRASAVRWTSTIRPATVGCLAWRKPISVSNVSGALLGGRIYVPGGTLGNTLPASLVPGRFDAARGSPLSPIVSPLAGESHGVIAALEVYDPQANTWSDAAPMPAAGGAMLWRCRTASFIYLVAGTTRDRAEVYAYDPQSNAWAVLTSMPESRGFMAAGSLKGLIYVVGGYDGEQELSTTEAYDPADEGSKAGPWSTKAPLNEPRAGLGLVSLGNRLYAIGGGWNNTLAYNEQYDVISGAWSRTESPIIEQWRNLGLTADGERIYAVGGWSGGYLALNEEYQAIYRVLLPAASSP